MWRLVEYGLYYKLGVENVLNLPNYARAHVRACSKNYNFSIHKYYSGNILYYF